MVVLWLRMGYNLYMPGSGRYQTKPMNKLGVFFLTWLVAAPSGFYAGTWYYASLDRAKRAKLRDALASPQRVVSYVAKGPTIEQRCIQKWGTDYRMREYCERSQREALAKLGGR